MTIDCVWVLLLLVSVLGVPVSEKPGISSFPITHQGAGTQQAGTGRHRQARPSSCRSGYERLQILGEGSYGTAHLVRERHGSRKLLGQERRNLSKEDSLVMKNIGSTYCILL